MAAGTASIIKRPQGHFLGTCYDATVYNNGYGIAVISKTAHGLNTGDYVYIYSLLSAYNGFWYVEKIGANDFEIREYPTASVQSFVNSGSIQFCISKTAHEYSCLHLPIVYKLTNTLWPNNTGGTSRTVSSFANDSGYVKLTLSGALDSFNALNYVKISGASSSSVNGSFQILTKTSTSIITINLPYNAAYSFSGGTVILYFNNYKIQVNIWAGLNSSHPWASVKPYQKILSLPLVPDGDNIVSLNVNEFLKPSQNIMSNNLQLDTLPNNTDFFSQFYIEFQEMYDQSDGTNVTTYSADLVSDKSTFEGIAVNAKLPFKNRYSGYLTEYVYGYTSLQKFLTSFGIPVLFVGQYFDISFILNSTTELSSTYLAQIPYSNDEIGNPVFTQIGYGAGKIGVFRRQIQQIQNEDEQQIFIGNGSLNIIAPSSWTDTIGSWDTKDGTTFAKSTAVGGGAVAHSYQALVINPGTIITITYSVFISGFSSSAGPDGKFLFDFYLTDGSGVSINQSSSFNIGNGLYGADGLYQITQTIIANESAARLSIRLDKFSCGGNASLTYSPTLIGLGTIYSETKTIKIDSKCSDQNYYLSWLNPLGGFDYWNFTGFSTHGLDIAQVTQQNKNIFTNWPNSWGEFANTIRSESKRITFTKILVRSQNMDKDQLDAICTIKSSPLVQIINSQYDTRTVLVDTSSFDIRKDGDKTFNISFQIIYTDPISAQEL